MPTFNSFDSILNPNKCFKNTPPSTLNTDNLPRLPEDWLNVLENKCREVKPNLIKNIFFKHTGDTSKYKSKKVLLEQLSLLTHRILGHLDAQLGCLDREACQLILFGLTEDIQECTPGFHIRINKLVNSLHVPKGLDQLLYLTQKSIIQEIASHLTVKVPDIYQVHVADRVIRIAEKLGLGIMPNVKKDIYKSTLSGKEIRQVLEVQFAKHYTPLKIPFLLAEQLTLIFNQYGYRGPKKNGYAIGPAENILEIIKYFLTNPAQNSNNKLESFFILDEIDEFGDPTRIYDINWNKIRQLFFQLLLNEKYFLNEPQFSHLIEYAYFQTLLPEKANAEIENRFIHEYLESKNYIALLDDIDQIQATCSDYWQRLIKNPIMIENIDQFFDFFRNQTPNLTTKNRLAGLEQTYKLFFCNLRNLF